MLCLTAAQTSLDAMSLTCSLPLQFGDSIPPVAHEQQH